MRLAIELFAVLFCVSSFSCIGQVASPGSAGPPEGSGPTGKGMSPIAAPVSDGSVAGGEIPARNSNFPQSGANSSFSYTASPTHPGIMIVQPRDGASDPILVSEKFLSMALKKPSTDESRLESIRHYPDMLESTRENGYRQMMPQATSAESEFEAKTVETDGATYSMTQDPLAPPFARVRITDKQGNLIDEFSVSRKSLEQTLKNPEMTGAVLENAITTNPFRLPEEARPDFKNLTEAKYWELLDEAPTFAKQEFNKLRKAKRELASTLANREKQPSLVTRTQVSTKSVKVGGSTDSGGPGAGGTGRYAPKSGAAAGSDGAETEARVGVGSIRSLSKSIGLGLVICVGVLAVGFYLRRRNSSR